MTQLAIQIPDDLQSFIDQSVQVGAFSDAGEFLTNLLYNVKAQSEAELSFEEEAKLNQLREAIQIGTVQLQQGKVALFDAEDIISRGQARLASKHAAHA